MTIGTFTWQNAKGMKIFARDWRPEGTPRAAVALVHGLGEHTGRYQHVAEAMNSAGFGLIGFDLPGHGQTEGPRGVASYDEILDDIDSLLMEAAQRYPLMPRFIYGHSLGGALVLYYCLKRRPDLCGAIATSPGLAVGGNVPGSKVVLAKILSRLAPSFTMENGLDVNDLSHDLDIAPAYKKDPLVHSRISTRLGLDLLTKGQWMIDHAAEFPLPLLLFQGSADRIVSPQATMAFAKAAPAERTTLKVWDNLFHETHNELDKQEVLQYLVNWIASHV